LLLNSCHVAMCSHLISDCHLLIQLLSVCQLMLLLSYRFLLLNHPCITYSLLQF
jgi:hypothetical protein